MDRRIKRAHHQVHYQVPRTLPQSTDPTYPEYNEALLQPIFHRPCRTARHQRCPSCRCCCDDISCSSFIFTYPAAHLFQRRLIECWIPL
ncbi:unnamed protein product [Clonostachys rosea f. rosea IK726]|uniref:Uncharacterized protein n=1 Tax=Clonostachys rosea f. rosea IK726 TaxID=1349383 RepID=A0ACA9UPK0_BIOOC|nr:unnamed protein product [Clonostachys rosea f. rosea IK726]